MLCVQECSVVLCGIITGILHLTTFKYFLHKFNEPALHSSVHYTKLMFLGPFTCAVMHVPEFIGKCGFKSVYFSLWELCQQKFYRQKIRDIGRVKHFLLDCWVR